jgi:hypothetical protein
MKVAMVIAKVVDAMSSDLPTGDQAWELVSEHIEVIVKTDRLGAQGDTKNWRLARSDELNQSTASRAAMFLVK